MLLLAISAAGNFGGGTSQGGLPASAALASVAAERPNIILITTDDQAASDMAWMPKTRALLGGSGVSFTQGISPHPLCCPARAEILTGQYAQNNGVYVNGGAFGGYPALKSPDNTLPAWLSAAGYNTAFTGKFLNRYDYETNGRPAGWDMWDPTIIGTYDYYGYTQANDGVPATQGDTYITDYIAAKSRTMIKRWSDNPDPFFLWASYVAPHNVCDSEMDGLRCGTPPRVEPDYANAYASSVNPSFRKPSFNEANVKDKPKFLRAAGKRNADSLQRQFLARIRALASVDDAVADTVAALDEVGELDNTMIIFTSDNGYLMGEHRYLGKRLAYEESLRVPFYMRGPGVPAGKSFSRAASMVDVAPTIVGLAGAQPGRVLDGATLMTRMSTPLASDRQTRLIQAGNLTQDSSESRWDYRGVREKRYTYVLWQNGFVELYDRNKDPYQLKNLADKWSAQPIRKEMRQRLKQVRSCAGSLECYRSFGKPPGRRHR